MLIDFFFTVRKAGVPASVKEFLTLIEALEEGVVSASVDDFYVLARATLVKDEAYFDRFDLAFSGLLQGRGRRSPTSCVKDIPAEWLRKLAERTSPRRRSAWSRRWAAGRSSWRRCASGSRSRRGATRAAASGSARPAPRPSAPTATTPRACASGRTARATARAVKVWDQREFRDYDTDRELGVRNIKLALRRLRASRAPAPPRCSTCPDTIRSTASNAGCLDLKIVPELRNAVKVLLFLDVGGSMDDHIQMVEELFSAARTEFKNLEHFYFHNCVYESVWKDNHRRNRERIPTVDVMRKYRPRLQGDLRGRRRDEPLRAGAGGRQRRALERRARPRLARAAAARLAARGVAQSRARGALGVDRLDGEHTPHLRRAHVPGDAERDSRGR